MGYSSSILIMDFDKLEAMLSSQDKDLRRLGQAICHEQRIDYYVIMYRNKTYTSYYRRLYCLSLYPGKFLERARCFGKIELSKLKKVDRGNKQRDKENKDQT
jgi:hypothetical protein